jgi:hypothetical protein
MKPITKVILVNCSIVVALLLQLWWGRPLYVVGLAGLFSFTLLNLIMFAVSKRRRRG